MKKYRLQRQHTNALVVYPKWLKSYHLLIGAIMLMMVFGAFVKHFSK